jgi:hypothetical protein
MLRMDFVMKKILAICLTLAMISSIAATVFAAPGSFLHSPSGVPTPTIVDFKFQPSGCDAKLILTGYAERYTLSDDLKSLIEKAYEEIANISDITKLNADFASYVASKNINSSKLAVSDLFDLHIEGCLVHEDHVSLNIVLEADSLGKFVGLLHMPEEGVWEYVSNAKVTNDGKYLEFSVDSLSPFAIVVDTSGETPPTGDNSMIYVYVILMAVSAIGLAVVIVKKNRQSV